jgi:DNA-binding NtrC family response regulator
MSRILLVDDDPGVRFAWEHVLFDAGHQVDTAESVEAGCQLIALHNYALVIADGRLSDGTGMMVADAAHEKGIPAMIVTGYAFSLHEAGVDLAQYDVLLKPIRPSELLEAVERLLGAAEY